MLWLTHTAFPLVKGSIGGIQLEQITFSSFEAITMTFCSDLSPMFCRVTKKPA